MKTVSRISAGLAALVLIAGCTSASNNTEEAVKDLEFGQQKLIGEAPDKSQDLRAFCPKTVIRAGTETYRTFETGVKKDDPGAMNSLRFQATVTDVARECNYSGQQLNIRVGIRGRVINGPTGATGTITAPVRVAVVSVANDVLYSELHQVPVTIPEGGSNARFSFVDSNIFIPAPDKRNLVIYVGFDEGPPAGSSGSAGG